MPVLVAYLVGVTCVYLTCAGFYRRLDPGRTFGEKAVTALAASLGGVPLGAMLSLVPIFVLCLVFGPVT